MSFPHSSGSDFPVHYVQVDLPSLIPSSNSNNYQQCQQRKTFSPNHMPYELSDKSKDALKFSKSSPPSYSQSPSSLDSCSPAKVSHCPSNKSVSLYINTNNNLSNADNISRNETDYSPHYDSRTKDFLSTEGKQAVANLKDTRAAIADRRLMFFNECPKSPSSPLRHSNSSSFNTNSSLNQRSSLLLDKEMNTMKLSNKDGNAENNLSSFSSHNLSESSRSSDLFKKANNRYSYRTVDLIKQCPPLELYTTSPILSPATTEINSSTVFRPKIEVAKSEKPFKEVCQGQTPPPPTLSLVTSESIVLQISESLPSSVINTVADNVIKLSFSPQRLMQPTSTSDSKCVNVCKSSQPIAVTMASHNNEAKTGVNDTKKLCTSKLEIDLKHDSQPKVQTSSNDHEQNMPNFTATTLNSNQVFSNANNDCVNLSRIDSEDSNTDLNKSQNFKTCLNLNDVTFFSSPENTFSFQGNSTGAVSEKSQTDVKPDEIQRFPSEESLPSTPNSGSLSSSMKSAGISKFKAFFTEGTNIFGSEVKQVYSTDPGISLSDSFDAKRSSDLKADKASFKAKRSMTKQQQQNNNTAVSKGSPIFKHKKSPTEKESQSHKESWKGRMARTIKRYGSGSTLLTSDTVATVTEDVKLTGVFGIPLEACQPSTNDPLVPMIVEVCTRIVEERGLDNQGIYRVPGNTGALKELQDEINKDEKGLCLCNEKWQDVNLVSSLLKLFFRKLPDSLITDELYESVISAMRTERSERRMLKLKKLLHDLPDHNFNTFRFLMKHLSLVSRHEEMNKMDAHNLAIMFGPTLIRPQDNNISVMARNMAEQCRVVEMIVTHCDWFFSSWDEDVYVPVDEESEDLTPVINEQMLAKAQSMATYTHTL